MVVPRQRLLVATPRLASVLILSLVLVPLAYAAPAESGTGGPADKRAIESVTDAAVAVLAALQERIEADEPLTPEFVKLEVTWASRHTHAIIASAPDRRRRIEAAQAYLKWLRNHPVLTGFRTHSETQATQLNFAIREAELWVARAAAGEAMLAPQDEQRIPHAAAPGAAESKARARMLEAARELWKFLQDRIDAD